MAYLESRAGARDREVGGIAGEIAGAGTACGEIGGLALIAFLSLYSAWAGMGLSFPLRAVAATLYGASAGHGAAPVVVGALMHVAVAAFWGIVFALLVQRGTGWATSLAAGLAFGLGVMLFMTFLVLPWANPPMYESVARAHPGTWFVAHVIFGGILGFVPAVRRRIAGEEAVRPRGSLTL